MPHCRKEVAKTFHIFAKISRRNFLCSSNCEHQKIAVQVAHSIGSGLKLRMAIERASKRRRLSPPTEAKEGLPGFATWNLEQDYENRPRKGNKKDQKSEKLPVKTADGWTENRQDNIAARPLTTEDNDSMLGSDDEDSGVADLADTIEPPKPTLPPKEQVRQAKEELAKIAGHISEDPEENVVQLGQLAAIASSNNITVKKLALGTQLAVYKDIIPGYRIRPLSKEELSGKISKDVRKLRAFEQGLLSGYKEYIMSLGKLALDPALSGVALTCACTLLTSVPHFNCRNDLIALLVKHLSSRNLSAQASRCLSALEQLFRDDSEGHASLEAVTQLTRMMKTKNYQINEQLLNTFLHLRLLSEFAHKASTNSVDKPERDPNAIKQKGSMRKREFRTKRERKVLKERKEVEKEFKEADAVVSYEERDKNQAETLKLVFVAYFRILKARTQHLMGAVLEGLARYSHLINQDFFGDVLEVLKDLINEAEALREMDEEEGLDIDLKAQRNATREALLCIITAFALLQGQTDVVKSVGALSLDLNFFITHLYRTLLPLALDTDIELNAKKPTHLADPNGLPLPITIGRGDTKVNVSTTTVLLLRSLESVLLPPTQVKAVPPMRVAAFTKQLMTASVHLPHKSSLAVLGLLGQVTKTHASKVNGLWNTEERRGDGVFDAIGGEVDGSNVMAATVWEGEVLRLHWDPRIRDAVKVIEGNVKPEGRS